MSSSEGQSHNQRAWQGQEQGLEVSHVVTYSRVLLCDSFRGPSSAAACSAKSRKVCLTSLAPAPAVLTPSCPALAPSLHAHGLTHNLANVPLAQRRLNACSSVQQHNGQAQLKLCEPGERRLCGLELGLIQEAKSAAQALSSFPATQFSTV